MIVKKQGCCWIGALVATLGLSPHANAADLEQGERGSYKDPPRASSAPIWTGFYVGAHGGYAFGKSESRDGGTEILNPPYGAFSCGPAVTGNYCDIPFEIDPEGGLAGVQIGYNQLHGSLLLGIEADLGWLGAEAEETLDRPANDQDIFDVEYSWYSTFALRAGYAMDVALVYAKAGLALAEIDTFAADIDNSEIYDGSVIDYSDVEVGWALGGGFEYAFSSRISLKAEYLALDLGDSVSRSLDGDIYRNDHLLHTVKVGLNVRLAD